MPTVVIGPIRFEIVPDRQIRLRIGPVQETRRAFQTPQFQKTGFQERIPGGAAMATLVLTDVQKAGMAVEFMDAAGNPVAPGGTPSWSVSDATVLTVEPSADGLAAMVSTTGKLGTSQVSVVETEPADGKAISASLDVQVVASEAATASISPGAPEPR